MGREMREVGMTPVIIHGDLWSMNLLWRKEGKGHRLEAIVDYQVGSGIELCSRGHTCTHLLTRECSIRAFYSTIQKVETAPKTLVSSIDFQCYKCNILCLLAAAIIVLNSIGFDGATCISSLLCGILQIGHRRTPS